MQKNKQNNHPVHNNYQWFAYQEMEFDSQQRDVELRVCPHILGTASDSGSLTAEWACIGIWSDM